MTVKIYLDNPYLKQINATIVDAKFENGKYMVQLDKTIFYPHMCGGQPRDIGTIDGVKVLDVIKQGDKIIHVLENKIYNKKVNLSIDWHTRFDHMQQHTGEHILSACFKKLFNENNIGFHLGNNYSYIDISMHNLTEDAVFKIEQLANEIIYSNIQVKNYIVQKDELKNIPIRKKPIVDKNIRIIEIDGVDCTPCAGTHVRNTGEIGIIKIRKWENYKGNTRIEFVCGHRALLDYGQKNHQTNNISSILSVKDTECQQGVEKLLSSLNTASKEITSLKKELAEYKKEYLLKSYQKHNDIKIVKHIFDYTEMDFNTLRKISSDIINNNENYVIIFAIKSPDKCQLIIGKSKNVSINAKNVFNSIVGLINGKGGGNDTIAQGGGTDVSKLDECIALAELKLKEIL
ncbi:alanyl-tRNA editing protein [Abyssisolibacter fermentans]|uniref:alanyl-tRNA editing protein n=1 Tax=Abyssisolibacter fermentans TaxID=1766203 RepID=UPI00082A9EB9|nr:DHHA1 domain-containing protein [Abyssisolibacter fermentans]